MGRRGGDGAGETKQRAPLLNPAAGWLSIGDSCSRRRNPGQRSLDACKMSSQVAAKQLLTVGTVKGVDQRVQAFASGPVQNVLDSEDTGNLRGKLGSIFVESEVAVSGVMGVDEGVEHTWSCGGGLGGRTPPQETKIFRPPHVFGKIF